MFIMNLLLRAKQLIGTITGMFCNIWGKKGTKNVPKSDRTQSSWLTTMRWPTRHSAQQFLAAKNPVVVPHPSLLVISHFQELNHRCEGDIYRMSLKFKKNCWPTYTNFQKVGSAIPAVTESWNHCINSHWDYSEWDNNDPQQR
jgi:hypothetical protein